MRFSTISLVFGAVALANAQIVQMSEEEIRKEVESVLSGDDRAKMESIESVWASATAAADYPAYESAAVTWGEKWAATQTHINAASLPTDVDGVDEFAETIIDAMIDSIKGSNEVIKKEEFFEEKLRKDVIEASEAQMKLMEKSKSALADKMVELGAELAGVSDEYKEALSGSVRLGASMGGLMLVAGLAVLMV